MGVDPRNRFLSNQHRSVDCGNRHWLLKQHRWNNLLNHHHLLPDAAARQGLLRKGSGHGRWNAASPDDEFVNANGLGSDGLDGYDLQELRRQHSCWGDALPKLWREPLVKAHRFLAVRIQHSLLSLQRLLTHYLSWRLVTVGLTCRRLRHIFRYDAEASAANRHYASRNNSDPNRSPWTSSQSRYHRRGGPILHCSHSRNPDR